MPREVQDAEGITWACVQALAGLSSTEEKIAAAQVTGTDDYYVVCTPSRGAQSVRLQLPAQWETLVSDDELLRAIAEQQERDV